MDKYEEIKKKSDKPDRDEKWIIKTLSNKHKQSYIMFSKYFNLLAVLETDQLTVQPAKSSKPQLNKARYDLYHDEIIQIIESKDRIDTEQDMDVDSQTELFQSFLSILNPKFTVKAYCSITCEITSITVFQPNSLIIANCSDKSLKLYDVSDETLEVSAKIHNKLKYRMRPSSMKMTKTQGKSINLSFL